MEYGEQGVVKQERPVRRARKSSQRQRRVSRDVYRTGAELLYEVRVCKTETLIGRADEPSADARRLPVCEQNSDCWSDTRHRDVHGRLDLAVCLVALD